MNSILLHTGSRVGILLLITLLGACSGVPVLPGITPYKIDVQQGNVVTQDMVSKLRPGMTRQQVRFVLGTPPIVDAFRNDRWDYVYRYEKAGVVSEHRRITLIFEGDQLKRIEGDVVPQDPSRAPAAGTPAVPPSSESSARVPQAPGTAPTAAPPAPAQSTAPASGGDK